MANRDASSSFNGYVYQRLYGIYLFLKEEFEYILEEGYEDIDLIKEDKTRNIYQLKYRPEEKEENLTYKSGLYKVIKSNFTRIDKINKIYYIVYNKTKNIFKLSLYKKFENKNFNSIRNDIVKVIKNQKNYEKNKKINEKNEKNKKNNEKNERNKKINEKNFNVFLDDKSKYVKLFDQINLSTGFEFNILINEIEELINNQYNKFVNISTPEYNKHKKNIIKDFIYNKLTEQMLKYPREQNQDKRKISKNDLKNEIIEMIKCCDNPDNIILNLFKVKENLINNIIEERNKEKTNIKINDIINTLDDFNLITKDLICFLIDLFNSKKDFIEEDEENFIKNKLVNLIIYNCDFDKDKKFDDKYYQSMKNIVSKIYHFTRIKNNNKKYKINTKKSILKEIDKNYKPKQFF